MDTPKTIELVITGLTVASAVAYLVYYTYSVFSASKCKSSGCDSCKAKLEKAKPGQAANA
ncbi:MAG: hypothetical protein ACPGN3_00820 [Opitutales bacterium]